jgi:DNA modification methylase
MKHTESNSEHLAILNGEPEVQAASREIHVDDDLKMVNELTEKFEQQYKAKFFAESGLNRGLVSFQANKSRAVYRWYKYKEAFSAGLVEILLCRYGLRRGSLLVPFAGSGTALFASSAMGLSAEGIELLPIGRKIIEARQLIEEGLKDKEVRALSRWAETLPWQKQERGMPVPELRITKGAYPVETARDIGEFLAAAAAEDKKVSAILTFALLCILESISYTRKDGQYLRWDFRSSRRQGKKLFDKGKIPAFNDAMKAKLRDIVADLKASDSPSDLFSGAVDRGGIALHNGSCLRLLPTLSEASFDCVLTSPPYCNRYDYTRTYALELAILGVDEKGLSALRQEMLSCTVENRSKDLLDMNAGWKSALHAADRQELLQTLLAYLESQKNKGLLNNNGIPRMVKGYFYEMACVIHECARVLKPGARLMMVNDNVRYAGASISVDVILSEIARDLGFQVEGILVLPSGKGNSSQQMGAHGRESLRKCVYVWRRE